MRHPTIAIIGLLAAASTLAGCGIHDPLNKPAPHRRTAPTNEVTGPPADPRALQPPGGAAPSALAAVERFGELYVNWTYKTLAQDQRRLAAISVGEASATERRAAAQTPADYELRHGKVVNRGRIIALSPLRPPRAGAYVVVTLERTTGAETYAGLKPSYHLTLATVQRVHDGWAVSQWRPQL